MEAARRPPDARTGAHGRQIRLADRTVADLAAEVVGYASRGLALHQGRRRRSRADTTRAHAAREAARDGTQVMYVVYWVWREPAAALHLVREWEDLDLAWIKDPFPFVLRAARENSSGDDDSAPDWRGRRGSVRNSSGSSIDG